MSALPTLLFILFFAASVFVWGRIVVRLSQQRHPLDREELTFSVGDFSHAEPADEGPDGAGLLTERDLSGDFCPVCDVRIVSATTECQVCGATVPAASADRGTDWNIIAVGLAFAWIGINSVSALLHLVEGGPEIDVNLRSVQSMTFVNALLVVVLLVALSELRPSRLAGYGIHLHDAGYNARVGALGFFAGLLPVYAIQFGLSAAGMRTGENINPLLKLLGDSSVPEVVFWVGLSAIVCAPLAEELVYRVILQGWLSSRTGPAAAIGTSSALFSLAHGWPDLVPLFALALILGYVFHRTRSYVAVVVMHLLFNAFNLGLSLLDANGDQVIGAIGRMLKAISLR